MPPPTHRHTQPKVHPAWTVKKFFGTGYLLPNNPYMAANKCRRGNCVQLVQVYLPLSGPSPQSYRVNNYGNR